MSPATSCTNWNPAAIMKVYAPPLLGTPQVCWTIAEAAVRVSIRNGLDPYELVLKALGGFILLPGPLALARYLYPFTPPAETEAAQAQAPSERPGARGRKRAGRSSRGRSRRRR